jgi:hypothetical protein
MLVSAYDVQYSLIPKPARLPCAPEIIFVDSGGYEVADDHDISSVMRFQPKPEPWPIETLRDVLDVWPARYPGVFVSYDHPRHRKSAAKQVAQARAFFDRYPGHLHDFLIKPEHGRDRVLGAALDRVLPIVKDLSAFHIIGVTEKELGDSLLERMTNVCRLRLALRDAHLELPIHVFGALDPLVTPLYFLAGADIFDGLTWLRFAYTEEHCVYKSNYGVNAIGIQVPDSRIDEQILLQNIFYLQRMQLAMREFLLDGDYSKFGKNAELVKAAGGSLRAKMGGRI